MVKIRYIFFILLFVMAIVSCQKDESIKDIPVPLSVENSNLLATVSGPGNFLALSGTLDLTIGDSTYIFDAQNDSVAFVNLFLDNKKYYGITAINKAHTMSFGISSQGYVETNVDSKVAGTQFLLTGGKNSDLQYALTQYPDLQEMSKIKLTAYAQDSVLAKGTFVAFLTGGTKASAPFYPVKGNFNLKIK